MSKYIHIQKFFPIFIILKVNLESDSYGIGHLIYTRMFTFYYSEKGIRGLFSASSTKTVVTNQQEIGLT